LSGDYTALFLYIDPFCSAASRLNISTLSHEMYASNMRLPIDSCAIHLDMVYDPISSYTSLSCLGVR
jgi:hypothetical protein